ncbi:MAG: DUF1501 domain-containing protein [Planctomycetes bacterium]|nr:DUF1501 domain-containing protein [Planctomycetota bacterium]
MSRRHFMRHLAATSLAIPALQWTRAIQANAAELKRQGKSCVLLWMSGGPATIDIWDLKPGAETGGEFSPISTSVPGIQISEHMPNVAKQMNHLAIVRSMATTEADHGRGTYKMHTGYVPTVTMQHPSFGAVTAYELGQKMEDFALPHFISVGGGGLGSGAGFLGMAHAPFHIAGAGSAIQNIQPPGGLAQFRIENRVAIQKLMDEQFLKDGHGLAAKDHKEVYEKTLRMMSALAELRAEKRDPFSLEHEDKATKERYGENGFGKGCLLARRLVEAGITFVEVGLGGWDTHNNTFEAHKNRLQPELDKGMAALVGDLADRGLLENILIVWMGEFGRTPNINQNTGRDHWARSWSVVMGGCGIKGGQVIGKTNEDGREVAERPLDTPDLMATFYKALGIKQDTQYTTPNGRPYWVVDKDTGAQPIAELFS